jgi:hypothetical protein
MKRRSIDPELIEMRFAHLKVQHGFERLRLRGLTGARDEFHLAAIVQNLKTMALRLGHPGGVCASIAVAERLKEQVRIRDADGQIASECPRVHRLLVQR